MDRTINIKGEIVLISDEDSILFNSRKWTLIPARQLLNKFYVVSVGRGETVYLHRLIMNARKGEVIDHINRNPLDCRRSNLRILTQSGNRANSTVRQNKKLPLPKGVFYRRLKNKPYYSKISVDGKALWLGSFHSVEQAVNAYQEAMCKYHPAIAI